MQTPPSTWIDLLVSHFTFMKSRLQFQFLLLVFSVGLIYYMYMRRVGILQERRESRDGWNDS